MRKEEQKNSKGITLIALVITVILLLILASIAMASLFGENGVITKAIKAREASKIAEYTERINLIITEELSQRAQEPKETLLIESLKETIKNQKWVEDIYMANEQYEETSYLKEGTYLFVDTKDGYELVVEVDNVGLTAKVVQGGKANGTYKVTYIEEGNKETIEVKQGFSIKLKECSVIKNGYEFVGWCEVENGESKIYAKGSLYKPQGDTKLYAIFEEKTVVIHFDANEGTGEIEDLTVKPGQSTQLTQNENITRIGYNFKNWNTKPDGSGTTYQDGSSITVTDDTTLYAIWEENVVATISINNDKKLTQGTEIAIGGTALASKIAKIELKLGTAIIYSEIPEAKTYSKTLLIDEISNQLNQLVFNQKYQATIKITTITGIEKETKIENVANYTIGTAENLNKLATDVNGGQTFTGETIYQIANIDLKGSTTNQFIGIGQYKNEDDNKPFMGTYEGNNKQINNIYVDENADQPLGLFRYSTGIIKNIIISGTMIQQSGRVVGGICGRTKNASIINCVNKISVNNLLYNKSGGIVGVAFDTVIENCINKGKVTANQYIGGILGSTGDDTGVPNGSVMIKNCKNEAEITGEIIVGGIVGYNYQAGTIENCYNIGQIEGTRQDVEDEDSCVGGIAGMNEGIITRSLNAGKVKSQSGVVGGIAGRNIKDINYCANSAEIVGLRAIGGIVGNNRGTIVNVYNVGISVSGINNSPGVGGIAGNQNNNSSAFIQNAYNKANIINAQEKAGGIVGGFKSGTVQNTYNMGTINASTTIEVGEIAGAIYEASAIKNSENVTYTSMVNWSQTTINSKLGSIFIKKSNSLPILNINLQCCNITF